MDKEKRVYFVGSLRGSTRARILVDYISGAKGYTFFYEDSHYLKSQSKNILKKVPLLFLRALNTINSFSKYLLSDVIYILPMGELNTFELKIASLLKKKVITDFYISKYDTYVNDKQRVDKTSKKAKNMLQLDQNLIDLSSEVIFLNRSEREYYLEVINRSDTTTKTFNIPLVTEKKEKASLNYLQGDKKKITLCWWGSYIPLHGLDKIIQSSKYLKEGGLDFELYLFGTSDKKSIPYKKTIDQLELNDCVFIDNRKNFADKSLEKFLLDECDLAFGNFGDSGKAKVVMVNKVVEAISMQLPVISQPTKALQEYFADKEDIYFCGSDPKDIADVILDAVENKEKLLQCAKNGYSQYRKSFSKEAYITEIQKII